MGCSVVQIANFPDHQSGTYFDGLTWTFTNKSDGSPVDLTGVAVKAEFRLGSAEGAVGLTLELGSGFTLVDNVLTMDAQTITMVPGTYHYDIKITFPGDIPRVFVRGRWEITQGVTQ